MDHGPFGYGWFLGPNSRFAKHPFMLEALLFWSAWYGGSHHVMMLDNPRRFDEFSLVRSAKACPETFM